MKKEKIGNYISAIVSLFIAIWLLNSEMPHKYFAAFICFIAAVQSYTRTIETDYCQRLSRRLTRVGLFLTLFWLIKILLSI